LTRNSFGGIDIAFFSAGGSISKEFAPIAAKAGCVVVDNSSAFRQDDTVPLVMPEINAADVKWHKGIIANPNCTTAITLMALYPLHQAFGVKRIFASSYQAVSGTGAQAIEELKRQVGEIVSGQTGDEGSLSAPDRLQRDSAGGFISAQRLHEGRNEDGKRRPQNHAPSVFAPA
jgi:aspartate-semialdehyde dehydrogenase